jgi:hypothetical protein
MPPGGKGIISGNLFFTNDAYEETQTLIPVACRFGEYRDGILRVLV